MFNKLIRNSPYIIFTLFTFQVFMIFIKLKYLVYLTIGLVSIFLLFIYYDKYTFKIQRNLLIPFAFILVIFCLSVPYFGSTGFYGFATFCMFPSFWFLYYSAGFDIDINKYIYVIFILAIVVSLLAFYQFYYDNSLFGALEDTIYNRYWNWDIPRAVSCMGSPQVLGFYLSLAIVLAITPFGRRVIFYPALLTIFLAALLSGNKSVFVSIGIFVPLVLIKKRRYDGLIYCLVALIFVVGIIQFLPEEITDTISGIKRIYDFISERDTDKFYLFKHYSEMFANMDVISMFFGTGSGTLSNPVRASESVDTAASESYLFQIYYEMGILPLIILLVLLCIAFFKANRNPKLSALNLDIFVIVLVVNMTFSHAFAGVQSGFFWGVIFYILSQDWYPKKADIPAVERKENSLFCFSEEQVQI